MIMNKTHTTKLASKQIDQPKEHELQLDNRYVAFVTYVSNIGQTYKSTSVELDNICLIDLQTEEAFTLNQVLPPLRIYLELLVEEKSEKYLYNNFDLVLMENPNYINLI